VTVETTFVARSNSEWKVPRLVGLALVTVIVVGTSLAAQQYKTTRQAVRSDAAKNAISTAQTVDKILLSRIQTLTVLGASSEFRTGDRAAMKDHFDSIAARRLLASAALGWIDVNGTFSVSADRELTTRPIVVADREYVKQVMQTHQPFVSGAFTSRLNKTPVFVISVPTFGDSKQLNGILTWAIRLDELDAELRSVINKRETIVLDRDGLILFGPIDALLRRADPRFDLDGARASPNRLLGDATSPTGDTHQLISQAPVASADWIVLSVKPVSAAFRSAWRTLWAGLGLLGAFCLVLTGFGLRTQKSVSRIQLAQHIANMRSEALRVLATELTSASSQVEVTTVLVTHGHTAVGAAISNVAAPVGYRPSDTDGDIPMAVSSLLSNEMAEQWTVLPTTPPTPMRDAYNTQRAVLVGSPGALADLYPHLTEMTAETVVRASASFPLLNAENRVVGVIGFGFSEPQEFDSTQLAVLDTASRLCGQALERSALFDREQLARLHAETLQQFSAELVLANSVHGVIQAISHHATKVFAVDSATVAVTKPISEVGAKSTPVDSAHPYHSNVALELPVEAFHPSTLIMATNQDLLASGADIEEFVLRAARALDREHRVELTTRAAERARLLAASVGQLASAETREEVCAAFAASLSSFAVSGGILAVVDDHGDSVKVIHQSEVDTESPTSAPRKAAPVRNTLNVTPQTISRLGLGTFASRSLTANSNNIEIASAINAKFGPGIISWAVLPLTHANKTIGLIAFVFTERQTFDDEQRVELTTFTALCANALARADRFEREHEVAVTLQASLLPHVPHQIGGAHLAGRYRPGMSNISVGGDWFDAITLRDGRYLLVVGDVVGHGIHSAAAMGKLSTATRALAPLFPEPAKLLQQIDLFAAADPDTRFASLAVVLVDPISATVSVSVAGHPPPLLVSPQHGACELDAGRGPALGIPNFKRTQVDSIIDSSSTIIMYTDGLTERRDDHVADRTRQLLTLISRSFTSADELADALLTAMLDNDQRDDVALLVVKVAPNPPRLTWSLTKDMRLLSGFRHELDLWLKGLGADDQQLDDILLATGEAVTNAIEHGSAHQGSPAAHNGQLFTHDSVLTRSATTVEVVVTSMENLCTVVISDHGLWHEPASELQGAHLRGRGLMLMNKLMDDVRVDKRNDGTVVTLTKVLRRRMEPST
jgi:anti-sigma regulatory factor (Ser/Thr protein kinase)/GAF domain-containing protein